MNLISFLPFQKKEKTLLIIFTKIRLIYRKTTKAQFSVSPKQKELVSIQK